MNENVINSLFGCFDWLRRNNSRVFYGFRVKNLFASLTHFLRASLRTLVNYFSVIDQKKPNKLYPMNIHNICFHGEIRKVFTWYWYPLLPGTMNKWEIQENIYKLLIFHFFTNIQWFYICNNKISKYFQKQSHIVTWRIESGFLYRVNIVYGTWQFLMADKRSW